MAVVSALISQISQYLRILNSIVVKRIICILIIAGNGKRNHCTIFKNGTDDAAIRRVKTFSAEYNFHSSRSQQALVKGEQRLVDLEDVVLLLPDEILNNDVELAAGTESVARAGDKITGLIQIQLQRDGKGNGCCLGGLVVRVVADFREQLAVYVGLLVDLSVLFPLRSMSFNSVSENPVSKCASASSSPEVAMGASS